jgi:TPR repeat protein
MFGFLKQWAQNASEYRHIQQELTVIMARHGVNFMHLHPEINKFLVDVAREEGSENAIVRLNETIETVANLYPGLNQEQAQQQLLIMIKRVTALAKELAKQEEIQEEFNQANHAHQQQEQSHTIEDMFEKCKFAAEKGDASAQYMLALYFIDGEIIHRDFEMAATWLRKAAAQGNADAHYLLGVMHEGGEGTPQDSQQAELHMWQAAEKGHTEAQAWIDQHTGNQSSSRKDQHNSDMSFNEGVEAYEQQDYTKALKIWLPLAEQGNAQAQYRLGFMCFKGLGVPEDYEQAMAWYRMASTQGNADANFSLGFMYSTGSGVTQDDYQAELWFRKAAAQGHMGAIGTLQARQQNFNPRNRQKPK